MPDKITVDAAGAGELLGVSERTIRDWTVEGILPSLDLGKHKNRLYSVDALRRWALERSVYTHGEEDHQDDDAADRTPKPQATEGRTVVRARPGRPRKSRASGSPLPLRIVER